MRRFPTCKIGRQSLTFHPAPFRAPLRAFAAIVFPWRGREALLCDIVGRGWCVPSGIVEPGETSEQAARREAIEEAGAIVGDLQYVGCYRITERGDVRWADCFTALVPELVEIGIIAESRARKFVAMEELPQIYYAWNPLIKLVFEHALEVTERSLRHR